HGLESDIWPAADDDSLIASLEGWLGPHLHGLTRLGDVAGLDLNVILLDRLDWSLKNRLEKELPTHLPLPGGRGWITPSRCPSPPHARNISTAWPKPPNWQAGGCLCGLRCCHLPDGRLR